MCFFLKYIVTLFYKKIRIKIVVSFLCELGPWTILGRGYKDKFVACYMVDARNNH